MSKKREEFGKHFIYFILILWIGTEVLFDSTIERLFGVDIKVINDSMAIVIFALLMAQIVLFQEYSKKELLIIAITSLFIIIATLNSNHNTMISTWIFIIASKNINFEKAIKITYFVQLFTVLLVLLLFFSGRIDEHTIYRGSMLRHSLGFSHPNQLGIRVFLLVVSRCYSRKEKLTLFDAAIVVGTAIFINRVANSKTSYYALIILAMLVLVQILVNHYPELVGLFSGGMITVAVFANLFSVVLSMINIKSYPFLAAIDEALSMRFSRCNKIIHFYGINMYGQEIKLFVGNITRGRMFGFFLDNAYVAILLRYGIIVYVIFSVLYICNMVYAKRTCQLFLLAILCLYSIYGIMETNFFSLSQNIFLLTMSFVLYARDESSKSTETRTIRITF